MNPWREQTLKDRNCHGKQTLQRRALRGAHRLPDRAVACGFAGRGLARPDQSGGGGLAPPGERPQFGHQQRPRLLRLQRRRTGAGPSRRNQGGPQLRDHSGRDPDPGDAFAGTRQGHQRAAAEHHLPLRFRLSRSRTARRINSIEFEKAALQSLRENPGPEDRRRRKLAVHRPRPAGRAGHDGASLRQLPQQPSGKPEARLEGRRRPRHPGSHHHPADRREPVLVQISAGLFRAGRDQRRLVPARCSAARPSRSRA